MAKKRIEVTDVNYNQEHLVEVEEDEIPSKVPTAEQLAEVIEGSETVVVDVSEQGDKLEVHLDADVVAKVENSLQLPLSHTEEKLVAVDTAGGQEMVGIGEGLSVENGVLKSLFNVPHYSDNTTLLKDIIQPVGKSSLIFTYNNQGSIAQGNKVIVYMFVESSAGDSIRSYFITAIILKGANTGKITKSSITDTSADFNAKLSDITLENV